MAIDLSPNCSNAMVATKVLSTPPFLENSLIEYLMDRLKISNEEYISIMGEKPKTWKDYKTYKKYFERLKPFFYILLKADLVPESFYMKYCNPFDEK